MCGLAAVQLGKPGDIGNKGPEGMRGQHGREGEPGQPGPRGMQGERGGLGLPGTQGRPVRSLFSTYPSSLINVQVTHEIQQYPDLKNESRQFYKALLLLIHLSIKNFSLQDHVMCRYKVCPCNEMSIIGLLSCRAEDQQINTSSMSA